VSTCELLWPSESILHHVTSSGLQHEHALPSSHCLASKVQSHLHPPPLPFLTVRSPPLVAPKIIRPKTRRSLKPRRPTSQACTASKSLPFYVAPVGRGPSQLWHQPRTSPRPFHMSSTSMRFRNVFFISDTTFLRHRCPVGLSLAGPQLPLPPHFPFPLCSTCA